MDIPLHSGFEPDANESEGQCLDLPSGDLTNARQVQTWQCTDNDFNQVWSI
jgi:hypothetical protein